jgi:uncharacterized cofD-like protein
MKRWAASRSYLKWLQPGMGVKRWLVVLIAGITLTATGLGGLVKLLGLSALQELAGALRPAFVSPELAATLAVLAGSLLAGAGIVGLIRSLLSAFRRTGQENVAEVVYRHRQRQRGPKVVAIGGGHGLNTLLRGLKEHTDHITAIVTVADDGGSSGRLRRDLGILPPGDFRNCIAALSDAEGLVTQLFQYRFGEDSDLEGHSFGNLYLTAMTAITGSFEQALEESSRVLAVRGKVIPSTLAQVTLCAELTTPDGGWQRIRGESRIGAGRGRVQRVFLEPENPPAYPQVIRAILDADLIVAGPGSLYTSVLPNLLVSDLTQAIASASAPKVYVCNVATQAGETEGYDVSDHVDALRSHVGPGLFQVVLANDAFPGKRPPGAEWVRLPRPEKVDYQLVTKDLVDGQYPWRHDPAKLATALMEFVKA